MCTAGAARAAQPPWSASCGGDVGGAAGKTSQGAPLGSRCSTSAAIVCCLHLPLPSHLLSHVRLLVRVACHCLQVLLTLSQQHTTALAGYAAFLTNILDYVDGYTDAQVHQVCASSEG